LNSETVPANNIGSFISWSTKKLKTWYLPHYSHASLLGISAKNLSTSPYFLSGRWPSKHLTLKGEMLQIKDLRVGQWKEPCIRLTQENSIENSVQDCLPYILIPNGPCKLFIAYPKWPCVCLKVNMWFTHYIMSSFQNLLYPSMCYVTVTMSSDVTCCVTVWSRHSNPNPSSKNRIKENKSKIK